jgi:hypothetical protein
MKSNRCAAIIAHRREFGSGLCDADEERPATQGSNSATVVARETAKVVCRIRQLSDVGAIWPQQYTGLPIFRRRERKSLCLSQGLESEIYL